MAVTGKPKRCARCGETKPRSEFFVRTTRKGTITVHSYCKPCKRTLEREWRTQPGVRERRAERDRERYRAKRSDPDMVAAHRERDREYRRAYRKRKPRQVKAADRRWRERLLQDPERHARYLAGRRIGQRLAVERVTGELAGAFRERTAGDAYVPPSKAEVVPAGPLRDYLQHRFPGWTMYEIGLVTNRAVSDRLLSKILREHARTIELDAADRFLTLGLGRPDLLLALYPPEAS